MCAPFSPRKYKSILRGFYNEVSLPGDSHVASLLRMTNNPQRAEGTHRAEGISLSKTISLAERHTSLRKQHRFCRKAKTTLKSCAFFGDDVFTAQVNFVINFTIFLRLSLVIKINRILLKIGGKSPLFFGNAVRISPF